MTPPSTETNHAGRPGGAIGLRPGADTPRGRPATGTVIGKLARIACVGLVAGCAVCHGAGCGDGSPDAGTAPAELQQTRCPVSGDSVSREHFVMYEGRKLYFHDRSCKLRFMNAPDKYADRAEEVLRQVQ